MLIIDGNALHPIDVADLIHQIILKCVFAQDCKNIMRIKVTVAQPLTRFNGIAVSDKQSFGHRNQVFIILTVMVAYNNDALTFQQAFKRNGTGNLSQYCRHFGTASFKELGNTGKTAGYILRSRGGFRKFRDNGTGFNLRIFFDHQLRAVRQIIEAECITGFIRNKYTRLQGHIRFQFGNMPLNHAGFIVDFFFEG